MEGFGRASKSHFQRMTANKQQGNIINMSARERIFEEIKETEAKYIQGLTILSNVSQQIMLNTI